MSQLKLSVRNPAADHAPAASGRRVVDRLRIENIRYLGSGGRSQENHSQGFVPAYLDQRTGQVYRSCFADGRPAPIHLIEGLPVHMLAITENAASDPGIRPDVVSGFVRAGVFYSRDQAARAMRTGALSTRV